MDRNLGATQVAVNSKDTLAFGDLYQWGRGADGHQCRNSGNTNILSISDITSHSNFITNSNSPFDWRTPQNNNLWQGINGINNPCPIGYRIPTSNELDLERTSWNQNNNIGAFDSPLKLPFAEWLRSSDNALIHNFSNYSHYWSSTTNGISANILTFSVNNDATIGYTLRGLGFSVRCIKD